MTKTILQYSPVLKKGNTYSSMISRLEKVDYIKQGLRFSVK